MDQDYLEDKLQIDLQKLTPFENFYTGVVSGCIEVACMQPVLFLKNASQQSRGRNEKFCQLSLSLSEIFRSPHQ